MTKLVEFKQAFFESLLFFYDPNLKGILEIVETDIEKLIVYKIIEGDLYYIILVLSRV